MKMPLLFTFAGWALAAATCAVAQVKLGEPPADREKERLQAIGRAKVQLSLKLQVPESKFTLESATEATWPDSSLGCPEKGHMYAQVVTRGWTVRLKADGASHEVHVSGKRAAICDRGAPPQRPPVS